MKIILQKFFVSVSLPWVWSYRQQLSGYQIFIFFSKIVFGVVGNYIYYEIASSSCPSSSTGLRLLRRFGFSCGVAAEYIGNALTPAAASNYSIVNAGSSHSESLRHDVPKSNLENSRQDRGGGGDSGTPSENALKDKNL